MATNSNTIDTIDINYKQNLELVYKSSNDVIHDFNSYLVFYINLNKFVFNIFQHSKSKDIETLPIIEGIIAKNINFEKLLNEFKIKYEDNENDLCLEILDEIKKLFVEINKLLLDLLKKVRISNLIVKLLTPTLQEHPYQEHHYSNFSRNTKYNRNGRGYQSGRGGRGGRGSRGGWSERGGHRRYTKKYFKK